MFGKSMNLLLGSLDAWKFYVHVFIKSGYFGFPYCTTDTECGCNIDGSSSASCNLTTGVCTCKANIIGNKCTECESGYYGFPDCIVCDCNIEEGALSEQCDSNGVCTCKPNISGDKCTDCTSGYFGFPDCAELWFWGLRFSL